MASTTSPGRPLDRTRDAAILEATLELFAEVGYDDLTLREVARRAQVSLSTIYRRWDAKSEMVAAALATTLSTLSTLSPLSPGPPGGGSDRSAGSPHATLELLLESIRANLTGVRAAYYPGLISAMRADPRLAVAVRTAAIDPQRDALRAMVRARVGPESADAMVDLMADLGPAILLYRTILLGESPPSNTSTELAELVNRVIEAGAA